MADGAVTDGDAGRPGIWRSVRVRITAVSVVMFALAFGIAAFAMVGSMRRALVGQVESDLAGTETRINQRVSQGMGVTGGAPDLPNIFVCRAEALPPPPSEPPDPRPPGPPECVTGPGPGQAVIGSIGGEAGVEVEDDMLVRTIQVDTPTGTQTLKLIGPLASVGRSVEALTRVLLVGTPVLVFGFGLMVWWLVGRALQPVERLRTEVDAISHSTLDRRLRPPGSHDEIDRLARTMNDMLDRLQRGAVEQQRFVSDASHELRTPLSVIRTALDVSREHPASLPPGDALVRIDRAVTRTEELVDELLELARIDEPGVNGRHTSVDLDAVIAEVVAELGGGDAATVTVSGTAGTIDGDPAQLRRLVGNLVGNAVAHARGQVVVTAGGDGRGAALTVDDDGPGIPPEARAAVFERFARLDGSRSRTADGGGWGLGLAIAEAVVRRHGGTIGITEAPLGGARFDVRLPRAHPAPAASRA